MDEFQVTQGYRATTKKEFIFYHSVPRLSSPWSHPMVFNLGPLNWESAALTTSPLLLLDVKIDFNGTFKLDICHIVCFNIIKVYSK